MNTIPNRQVICTELIEMAKNDNDIMVLVSDSRGSASLTEYAEACPDNFLEIGIAEQNIVGIAAGLASDGKKSYVASPACFLSMRSVEQVKVDCAYSNTNVKLIGISGGISYGALGMSHHSAQDLAVMRAIPNMTVIMPADRFETAAMMKALKDHVGPAYIRVGRNPVEDVYREEPQFVIGKANVLRKGNDVTFIASGETVGFIKEAAELLAADGIEAEVINIHTIKPFDADTVIRSAQKTGCVISVEEHSIFGGLGAATAEVLAQNCPVPMKILGIPDEPAIAGTSAQVYAHYGLNAEGIARTAKEMLAKLK